MDYRIGFGFDVHQLEEGRPFWLGGIQIECTFGPVGHSDADVLIHAICDALLGALALGDIGKHFPDTDPAYKSIDSKILLSKVFKLISDRGYSIGNIDSTVCLESPKIGPYIDVMQNCLSQILQVEPSLVSIKATTNEQMGFIGRKEGITAYAIVLLAKTA